METEEVGTLYVDVITPESFARDALAACEAMAGGGNYGFRLMKRVSIAELRDRFPFKSETDTPSQSPQR